MKSLVPLSGVKLSLCLLHPFGSISAEVGHAHSLRSVTAEGETANALLIPKVWHVSFYYNSVF